MNRSLVSSLTILGLSASLAFTAPAYADEAIPTCFGQPATIVGTPGNDILVGTHADDVIVGLDGHDTIRGGWGDDLICGGNGNDTLYGDNGDDRLAGEGGSNYLDGGSNNDILQAGTGVTPSDTHDYTGKTSRRVLGDFLQGGRGDDVLQPRTHATNSAFALDYRVDTLSFAGVAPVTVDLVKRTATGQGNDTIVPIGAGSLQNTGLQVFGSDGDDVLRGQATHLGTVPDWTEGEDRSHWGAAVLYPGRGNDRVLARGSEISEVEFFNMDALEWTANVPKDYYVKSGNDRYDFSQSPQVMCDNCESGKDLIIGSPNADVIEPDWRYHKATFRLGRGNDVVHLRDERAPTVSMGQDSGDRLYWYVTLSTPLTFNASTGRYRGGKSKGRISGVNRLYPTFRGPLIYTGTKGADVVIGQARRVTAHLGGGNDRLRIKAYRIDHSKVSGGAGRDRAAVLFRRKIVRGIYSQVEKVAT